MNYKKLLELGRPPGPGRLALPVAGDAAKAKQVVLQLVDELGFDGIDAGGLEHTPFFHTIQTMVAIFLAKVRRAISGRMPLASNAA
jgi:predicted dinucleotide-binding enzyme